MPSTRSKLVSVHGYEAWGIALLIIAAVLATLQALAGWHALVYLKGLLSMLLMGHIGMLLGAALDFGSAGLTILAGWCSTLGGAGLGNLWFKLGIATL